MTCVRAAIVFLRQAPMKIGQFIRNTVELCKAQDWPFVLLFILLIIESIFALQHHILMCNLPLGDTLLVMVSLFHLRNTRGEAAAPLFQRICGCVSFCAILFVNASHALEMMTEILHLVPSGHSDNTHGNETMAHNVTTSMFYSSLVPASFLPIIIIDVVIKLTLLCANRLPSFSLSRPLQDSPLLSSLDSLVTFGICIISAAMIVPAFCEMKPYVFADTPQFFETDKFMANLSTNLSSVECTHIHVYRIWPMQNFEALIHINIQVDKSKDTWGDDAGSRYADVSKYIRSIMQQGGAERVVIEPRFIDRSIDNPQWQGCVGATCYVEDRGCCSMDTPLLPTEA